MSSAVASSSKRTAPPKTLPSAKRSRPSPSKASFTDSLDGESDEEIDPQDMSDEVKAKHARKEARVSTFVPQSSSFVLII